MKAHVDTSQPWTNRIRVMIYDGPTRYMKPDGDWATMDPNTNPDEWTFEFDRHVAEVLADALSTLGSPAEATRHHLNDAIKVRDRLLALVEKP